MKSKCYIRKVVMIVQWGLISSVTLVSTTMLMIFGAYIATLPQAQEYYSVSRAWIVFFFASFNLGHVILTPFILKSYTKYYVNGVIISTVANGIACVGRYLAQQDYNWCMFFTGVVAVAHIPIIAAPYGLLKLFPDWQKGYAASIPLFLPVLGINFCIIYGIAYIVDDGANIHTIEQIHSRISDMNFIIAILGIISTVGTVVFMLILKDKIEKDQQPPIELQESTTEGEATGFDHTPSKAVAPPTDIEDQFSLKGMATTLMANKTITINLIAWGAIVGVNWTYGSLFGIIFDSQNLTENESAWIGLAANLSTALFSNLGTFIQNRFKADSLKIIQVLNLLGIVSAILVELSRFFSIFQGMFFLITVIIVLRAGFSSFVSLALVEMENIGMNSLVVSNFFFWIANIINLLTTEMIDQAPTDLTLFIFTALVSLCVYIVHKNSQPPKSCPI